MATSLCTRFFQSLHCRLCDAALQKDPLMEMQTEISARLNVKKRLFLQSSGEELFLMSALCGFPAALFDLFLESNVMIVADFEIWKHTCCVSLQSCFARFSLAHFSRLFAAVFIYIRDFEKKKLRQKKADWNHFVIILVMHLIENTICF